ncbi:O-antigen ligase family protein [Gymnodinialimonas sp. 57CJ19]|uniref:O-antigen ligase family protein n=1 Tax=Gymnodinialimonas sp. 57CJ19 TaxID=3138498 RepID=UPI003134638A
MKQWRNKLSSVVLAFALYLSISSGGLGLADVFTIERALVSAFLTFLALLSSIVLAVLSRTGAQRTLYCIFATVVFYCIIQFLRADSIILALGKLDGLVFASGLVFILGRAVQVHDAVELRRSLIVSAIFVLVLTIAYKWYFGFWDREVRFFLNGPIIFGWLMAVSSLLCLDVQREGSRILYISLAVIFLLALFWTESKGPLIGYMIGATYLMTSGGKYYRLPVIVAAFWLAGYVAVANNLFPSRFLVLERMISGTLLASDFGSVGVRQLMWLESLEMFSQRPFFGMGLGNWASNSMISFQFGERIVYPHNIIAEILSEHGLVGAVFFGVLFWLIYLRSSRLGRCVFITICVSLLFTGDMGNWHFLVALPIVLGNYPVAKGR